MVGPFPSFETPFKTFYNLLICKSTNLMYDLYITLFIKLNTKYLHTKFISENKSSIFVCIIHLVEIKNAFFSYIYCISNVNCISQKIEYRLYIKN